METKQTAGPDTASVNGVPCIAVLPLKNLSGNPDESYFCEGLAAEILVCLARTPGIRVVARSSVFSLDPDTLDIHDLKTHLCATAVLSGEIRRQDDRVEISVQLMDTDSCNIIWSGRYDRDLVDVFMVQDEIVANVVRALPLAIDDTRLRKIVDHHAANVDAYKSYLHGRHQYWQFSRQSIEEALAAFVEATKIDDSYTLAYCGITDCYWYLYQYVAPLKEYVDASDQASLRALELSPNLAEAYASRALALSLRGRYDECSAAFERAIALDPKLFEAHFLFARTCYAAGEIDRAAELFEKAHQIRPEDYQSLLLAAQAFESLGNLDRATDLRRHGVAIAEEHLFLNPGEIRALYMGANGLVQLGEIQKGLDWLEQALRLEADDPMLLYNAGCIYSLVGLGDRALGCLERAVEGGLRQKGWFAHDPNLDAVRDHPRFVNLSAKLV